VLTTHDDQDHAGGLAAIRRLFTVREAWSADELRAAPRVVGGVRLTALAGPPDAQRRSRNDNALVLRLDYGLASFLLASDITAATEAGLVSAAAPLAATVLKVAHHGSRGSSTPEFLRAVGPLAAVISVGGRNPYGHPSPETLGRLAAAGATIYRTDQDGAVVLETDGRALSITRWASRRTERYCLDPETVC
jgi:beta-lactamase superfamily II metal-dependent hydrolase